MQKIPGIILLLLSFLPLSAQILPPFPADQNPQNAENSLVVKEFSNRFEAFIAYHSRSYYQTETWFTVLGFRNKKWERIQLEVKWEGREKAKILKTRHRKKKLKKKNMPVLLEFFETNDFYSLDNQQLNIHEKHLNDSTMEVMNVSHGSAPTFEFWEDGRYRKIYSFSPKSYEKLISIPQRVTFIHCLDKFSALIFEE